MASLGARGVAALLVVAIVVGTCAGAHGSELEVHSDVFNETIAVYYPPEQACCAKCNPTTHVCPEFCRLCTDVNLNYTQCRKLDSKAGPYPLSYLKVEIPLLGDAYCVADDDLSLLTNHALVTVSNVKCGDNGLAAAVAQIQGDSGSRVCNQPATIKSLQVICLESC